MLARSTWARLEPVNPSGARQERGQKGGHLPRNSDWSRAEGRSVVQGVRAQEGSEENWVDTRWGRSPDTEESSSEFQGNQSRDRIRWSGWNPLEGLVYRITKSNLAECDCEHEYSGWWGRWVQVWLIKRRCGQAERWENGNFTVMIQQLHSTWEHV